MIAPLLPQVEAECEDVEQQVQHMQKHMAQARREADQLEAFARRAHKELLESSSWGVLSPGEAGPEAACA